MFGGERTEELYNWLGGRIGFGTYPKLDKNDYYLLYANRTIRYTSNMLISSSSYYDVTDSGFTYVPNPVKGEATIRVNELQSHWYMFLVSVRSVPSQYYFNGDDNFSPTGSGSILRIITERGRGERSKSICGG